MSENLDAIEQKAKDILDDVKKMRPKPGPSAAEVFVTIVAFLILAFFFLNNTGF